MRKVKILKIFDQQTAIFRKLPSIQKVIVSMYCHISDKKDREQLLKVLELSKQVLHNVDEQVAAAERRMRLIDIYNRLESRSFAVHRGKKFRVRISHYYNRLPFKL